MTAHPKKDASEKLGDTLGNAAERAADLAHQHAEAATQTATDHAETKVSNAADAAAAAAAEFEPGSRQAVAADQIASHLQGAAAMLRETDFNSAAAKATGFARENPLLFLSGAALLGFAATRFLKASDKPSGSYRVEDTDPWTGHATATRSRVAPAHPTSAVHQSTYANGRAS